MSGIRTKGLVSGVLLAFAVSISSAEENEHIAACDLVTASEARIACLEDAIRRLADGTSNLGAETPETPSSTAELRPEGGSQAAEVVSSVAVVVAAQAVVDVPLSEAPETPSPTAELRPEGGSQAAGAASSVAVVAGAQAAVDAPVPEAAVSAESVGAEIAGTTSDGQAGATTTSTDLKSESADELQAAAASVVVISTENKDSSDELEKLGQEQLDDPTADKSDKRVSTRVVSFEFVAIERLRVRLENGQVWRQTDADRPKLSMKLRNLESFEVEMWKTGLGGYRMKIVPIGRTVRVKRLQ